MFGKATKEQLESIDEATLLDVMKDVSKAEVPMETLSSGISVIDLATLHDKIPSKSEARKLIKSNGFSLNKEKITDEKAIINCDSLIDGKYMLLQKGKKDYSLIMAKS